MDDYSSIDKYDLFTKVNQAIDHLHKGKIVLVSTDTVPGMAVSPFQPNAISRVYRLKSRQDQKPLVWMVADFDLLSNILVVSTQAKILIKKFWPGALTLIFEIKKNISKKNQVLRKAMVGNSLAVRIPAGDRYLTTLLKKIGEPIAVTSVNRSGNKEITDFEKIRQKFKSELEYTFYPNKYEFNSIQTSYQVKKIASTVVDVREDIPRVVRQGQLFI